MWKNRLTVPSPRKAKLGKEPIAGMLNHAAAACVLIRGHSLSMVVWLSRPDSSLKKSFPPKQNSLSFPAPNYH